jgi:hypothetical protein
MERSAGVATVPPLTLISQERLHVLQLGRIEERDRSKAGLDQGAFQAIERLREIADHLPASDQRISNLRLACRP